MNRTTSILSSTRTTWPPSHHFDPGAVGDPEHYGGVAWTQFNENFERLLNLEWRKVNAGASYPWWKRLLRLWLAYMQQKQNAILDFQGKARVFARLDIPPNPSIVFFGAEVGWEAVILQALFGDKGNVLLIDKDPAAYERYLNAPREVRIRAPQGWKTREIVVRRDPSRIEYLQADFFDVERRHEFDVGIDWGLIEHFQDAHKPPVLKLFQRFLKDGGLQISSCPRNTLAVRLFYRAFSDELNFGYRELMGLAEFKAHLLRADFQVEQTCTLPAHNIVASRVRHSPANTHHPATQKRGGLHDASG